MIEKMHGGDVWKGGAPETWLDFSANLNPDGPPDWALDALTGAIHRVQYYPDARDAAARMGLAAHLGVDEACVMPTAGGAEAIALAGTLEGPHIITDPSFCEYLGVVGARLLTRIPRTALEKFAVPQGANVWLCNPCNPTGEALERAQVLSLLERVEHAGGRLVVDEAFIDYCPEVSVRAMAEKTDALVVLGSMTKALCVPGVRLGYLLANASVLAQIAVTRQPWTLNCFAGALAEALPGHEAYFEALAARNAQRRASLREGLARLGITGCDSRTNFLLVRLDRSADALAAALERKRILVRTCGGFEGLADDRHLRLAVRNEADNARLLRALEAVL